MLICIVYICSSGGKIIQIGTYRGAAFQGVENLSIDVCPVLHRCGSQTSTIVFINVRGTRCRAILVHVTGTVWNSISRFHSVHSVCSCCAGAGSSAVISIRCLRSTRFITLYGFAFFFVTISHRGCAPSYADIRTFPLQPSVHYTIALGSDGIFEVQNYIRLALPVSTLGWRVWFVIHVSVLCISNR